MSSLQTPSLIFSSSSVSKRSDTKAAIISLSNRAPPRARFAAPAATQQQKKLAVATDQLSSSNDVVFKTTAPREGQTSSTATEKMHAVLEAVSDRIEMHENIGRQRDNWNALLLGSLNAMTLSAATLSAVSAAGGGPAHLALNLSSAILFSAAAGISAVMAKIQPSQLAEEQRGASRLFRRLQARLETALALRSPAEADARDAAEEVLSLDRAFPLPLPLLGGAMLEKLPERFEPAVWWPERARGDETASPGDDEMREIARVLREKDSEEYERLGGLALRANKAMAAAGPAMAAMAAAGAVFVGSGEWAAVLAVAGGAAATAVNAVQHGFQAGMVVEMYRNSAGFLKLLEETIERESSDGGEVFRMKVALDLGRSLPEIRSNQQVNKEHEELTRFGNVPTSSGATSG